MRYIIRKFIEAETVSQALQKERDTPVHDAFVEEGERPRGAGRQLKGAVGFGMPEPAAFPEDGATMRRKKA